MGGAVVPDGHRAKGAEIITPSRNGYVHPNGQAPAFAGRSGNAVAITNHNTFSISGVGNNLRQVAEEIGRYLNDMNATSLRGIHADWD